LHDHEAHPFPIFGCKDQGGFSQVLSNAQAKIANHDFFIGRDNQHRLVTYAANLLIP
jgi:hypothetical protein